MTPIRVQRKRVKGYRLPENTVSVTRPGKWGNPFKVNAGLGTGFTSPPHGVKAALELYEKWLNGDFNLVHEKGLPPSKQEIIDNLKGKNLACFCKEGDSCHGDILLKYANQ